MNHELFDRAKKEVPGCVRKVKPVAGDISEVEWIGPRSGAPPETHALTNCRMGLVFRRTRGKSWWTKFRWVAQQRTRISTTPDFHHLHIQVIIHVAATIRFQEPVKHAAKLNIKSVYNVLALARSLKECVAVVHTSTAYAHTYQTECPEDFLPPS